MDLFHVIEGGQAIICSRGIYRQVKLYRNGKDIYAGCGAGFIKLYASKGTSAPKISWLSIEGDGIDYDTCKQPKWIGITEDKPIIKRKK